MWAEEDRPREKCARIGIHNLSDAELLTILIKSGTPKLSALDIAKQILNGMEHNLTRLAKSRIEELSQFQGIGPTKAITIMAAMELGRRRQLSSKEERLKINSSKLAYDFIGPILKDLEVEEFWILLLNGASLLLSRECISRGGISSTVVDARIIFKRAINQGATSIILVHNHPSGRVTPSQQDIRLTKNLVEAGKIIGIPVSDHLIIAGEDYYSFCDEGNI